MTSLYNSLHDVEDSHLTLKFFKTHMMYILITSHEDLTAGSVTFAADTYQRHIAKVYKSYYNLH